MLRRCLQPSWTRYPAVRCALLAGEQRNTNGPATEVAATWRREHGSTWPGLLNTCTDAQFSLDEKTGQVVEQFHFPAPLLSDTDTSG